MANKNLSQRQKPKQSGGKETKSFSQTESKKETKIVLQATRNTQLPDGTFVGEGKEVVVASSYAEKVLKEANTPFKLIIKK